LRKPPDRRKFRAANASTAAKPISRLTPASLSVGPLKSLAQRPSYPVVAAPNGAYAALTPATWVGAPSPGNQASGGVYVFQFKFDVPRCVIPGGISIAGKFAADNSAVLTLDGATLATSAGYTAVQATNYTKVGIGPGSHTVEVTVTNVSGPMAMALQGTLTVACPTKLEQGNTAAADSSESDGKLASACSSSCNAS
jgi:hypothetical protein